MLLDKATHYLKSHFTHHCDKEIDEMSELEIMEGISVCYKGGISKFIIDNDNKLEERIAQLEYITDSLNIAFDKLHMEVIQLKQLVNKVK